MEYLFLFSLVCMNMLSIDCLRCWKCIGEWCSENPYDDYRVDKVTCPVDASCMKVYYKMYDNSSQLIESVTRGCSVGQCIPTSGESYRICLSNIRIYGIDGCPLKSCCDNHDLCNAGSNSHDQSLLSLIIPSLYMAWKLFENP
ncbi:hypothetical protein LOTGIDRAFT_170886 [Lottia gigantea]|uniref:UPAR/Ly6 domain-containing protein n=1 Tax=Lottia gigantea TaxID=225164 RepID=V4B9V9_LOTGI|nr:hypothetical protein LOTGIDRAFT_170886 [Lottia gigantea]ESP04296.1 hypothetical protein LOTGIDRAFT_170886 [Lottia gigantea]